MAEGVLQRLKYMFCDPIKVWQLMKTGHSQSSKRLDIRKEIHYSIADWS